MIALWLLVHEIKSIIQRGSCSKNRKYPSGQLWQYVQLLRLATSVLYVVTYVYRFVLVSEVVEGLRSTWYTEYVNISLLAYWDDVSYLPP